MRIKNSLNFLLYECKLKTIITDDIISEVNQLYKKHKYKEKFVDNVAGLVWEPSLNIIYFLLDIKYCTHNTIAHEIYHITQKMGKSRGINDEESMSWLCGYITENIYKFLEKSNIKIKHG